MSRPPAVRVNEGIVLFAGAAFLMVMVDDDRFFWTPLVLGLALLAAGTLAGRASGYWGPGCVLVGWGAAVVSSASPSPTWIPRAFTSRAPEQAPSLPSSSDGVALPSTLWWWLRRP